MPLNLWVISDLIKCTEALKNMIANALSRKAGGEVKLTSWPVAKILASDSQGSGGNQDADTSVQEQGG